jgi:hypothetical protein
VSDGAPLPGSAFGVPADELGDAADVLTQGIELEAEGPVDTPVEVPAVEAPAPEAPVAEAPPEAPVEGEQPTEAERLLAGKYKTTEDLETGYREQSRLVREKAAQAAQAQRELLEMQQAVSAYLEQQKQAAPVAPPAAGEPTDAELQAWGLTREGYQAVKPVLDRIVAEKVEPLRAQQEQTLAQAQQRFEAERQQQQQQVDQVASERVFSEFYQRHADYAPDTDGYEKLVDRIQSWNQAWTGDPTGQTGGSLDVLDPTALDIAVEAVARPALGLVLEANPNLISTDAGMDMARVQADLLEARQRAVTQAQAGKQPAQTLPHVESGSSGGGPRPLDAAPRSPIDEILEYHEQTRKSSAFSRG